MRKVLVGLFFGMLGAISNEEIRQAVIEKKVFIINDDGAVEIREESTGHSEEMILLPHNATILIGESVKDASKKAQILDTVKAAHAGYTMRDIRTKAPMGYYMPGCPVQNTLMIVPTLMRGSIANLSFNEDEWKISYVDCSSIKPTDTLLCVTADDTYANLIIAKFDNSAKTQQGTFFTRITKKNPSLGSKIAAEAISEIHNTQIESVTLQPIVDSTAQTDDSAPLLSKL